MLIGEQEVIHHLILAAKTCFQARSWAAAVVARENLLTLRVILRDWNP